MRNLRKLTVAFILALTVMTNTFAPIIVSADDFATEPNVAGEATIVLDAEATIFSIAGPSTLIVDVASDTTVVTATDLYWKNTSPAGGIKFVSIGFSGQNEYTISDYDADFKKMKVGRKTFGFMLNNVKVQTDGSFTLDDTNFPVLYPDEELPLDYDAKIPAVKTQIDGLQMSTMSVAFDWDAE